MRSKTCNLSYFFIRQRRLYVFTINIHSAHWMEYPWNIVTRLVRSELLFRIFSLSQWKHCCYWQIIVLGYVREGNSLKIEKYTCWNLVSITSLIIIMCLLPKSCDALCKGEVPTSIKPKLVLCIIKATQYNYMSTVWGDHKNVMTVSIPRSPANIFWDNASSWNHLI